MLANYIEVTRFFMNSDSGEVLKYGDLIHQLEMGDSMEAIAFDQSLYPSIRSLARQIIRKASKEVGFKPSEEAIDQIWLKAIEGLVPADYYIDAQNFVRFGEGSYSIDEHCRAFRLFWHATIFTPIKG